MIQRICSVGRPLLLTCVLATLILASASCSQQPRYPQPVLTGPNAVIEISSLAREVPKFYTYRYQGKPISFFVLKLDDTVNSFLDACASCYSHKQGYRSDYATVTCRYCGMKFPVFKLEKGIGGCYPIKINGRIEKGKYLIAVAALEAEVSKF